MFKSFFGIKEKTSQAFDKEGKRQAVTVLTVLPLVVKRVKTKEQDGYEAIQVEIVKKGKPALKEIAVKNIKDFKAGDQIKLSQAFQEDEIINVRGITSGKGFAGVVKRHGFKGGPHTHGQSDRERAPGAIGQGTSPGRVWKGKRMAGHMGTQTVLIKNLKVFKIDEEKNQVFVTGPTPGKRGGILELVKKE